MLQLSKLRYPSNNFIDYAGILILLGMAEYPVTFGAANLMAFLTQQILIWASLRCKEEICVSQLNQ